MGSKAFHFLVFAIVVLMISSEVAARDFAEASPDSKRKSEAAKETKGLGERKEDYDGDDGGDYDGDRGGYYGGRGYYGGGRGRGYYGGRGGGGCYWGCCGGGYDYGGCRCCASAAEAAAQKTQEQSHN